jgi:ADP-ribose pyrophosphatase YjhB (NUDIX family)
MLTFDDDLRERIADNLSRHRRREHQLDGRRHAAVAVVICDSDPLLHDGDPTLPEGTSLDMVPGDTADLDGRMVGVAGGAAFLLCRRAARLSSHSAQWALPGGRLDDGERPVDAALREVDEELGVRFDEDSVLGLLDDYPTRSGYVITPVVVWGEADPDLRPAADEVQAVFRVGLHNLCREDSPRYVDIPESDRPVVQVPLGNDLIHAPTGAVLVQFRWVALDGEMDRRVDCLEQPVFAWR